MQWNRSTLIGGALALIGLSLLIKVLVGIDIPVIRMGLACLFIYFGIRIAMGTLGWNRSFNLKGKETVAFSEGEFRLVGESEGRESLLIAFGKGALDISGLRPSVSDDSEVELAVIMGDAAVYFSPITPIHITVQSVVGDAALPDGNSVAVGSLSYHTPGIARDTRRIRLKITVFCGRVKFIEGNLPEQPATG